MARPRKRWRYSTGRRPHTVTVEEFELGGNFYVRLWSRSEQKHRYRSLRHRDRNKAMAYADALAARLREGTENVVDRRLSMDSLFRLYNHHRTPLKGRESQKDDGRRMEMWTRVLGANKDASKISLGEWERFTEARRSGAIDPRGQAVPEEDRRTVRDRTIEADFRWLKAVLAWATKWSTPEGHYLLRENPVRGFDIPREKNPRRAIATHDRFEKIRARSDEVLMESRSAGHRTPMRSYLSEVLDIVNGTGRRIAAVCQLRFDDLKLDDGPHGAIRWPADTDKMGLETTVPIGPEVRAAIDRILMERPGIGKGYLFPSPYEAGKPLRYELAGDWLRKAERLAGVPKQDGALWHAYRRKWATERKHLPEVDVAAAGGWADPNTLRLIYQQPDQESMLKVVLEAGQLREHGS